MKRINQNSMAKWVTMREGGKRSQSIAQVKETIRLTLCYLHQQCLVQNASGVMDLIETNSDYRRRTNNG